MDQYTTDLLTKWGLVEYVTTFADARMDVTALQLLTEADIPALINPIGDRLRFKSNLKLWKNEISSATSVGAASAVNDPIIQNECPDLDSSFVRNVLKDLDCPPNQELHSCPSVSTIADVDDVNNTLTTNSVLEILKKTTEGRAIIERGNKNNGLLNIELRKELSNIVIRSLMEIDPRKILKGPDFLKLAHEIQQIFSEESPAVYYAPYLAQTSLQPKRNASGILYNIYEKKKRHLRNLGVLPPSKRSRGASTSSHGSSLECIPATGLNIVDLQQGDPASVEEKLSSLESPDPGPWQLVECDWAFTIAARQRYLYYEKGTLADYLNKYPILKSQSGYVLFLQDYDKLYPDNGAGLSVLSMKLKRIIEIAKAKAIGTKDVFVKKQINEYIASIDENIEESEMNACLLLLPYIINISGVRRKELWKPSRAEFRDGFIMQSLTESDVLPILAERRNKLSKLGVTFQPVVMYVGESLKSITKCYVICEDVLYEFLTLPRAVDVAFKVFHATGTQYPHESYDIWLLLQLAFYELKTQFDRPSASLKQVLVDLGLRNIIK